ncbi:TadE family type IV pilus minor pilin [Ruania albidiflava]|uniref:TadE family type IV pilus minor pilin n=1 Tax=Ruania albidiflava TaxID=366586 RepID=UPI0003B48B37|nr:TadE family type IV pilus minor pilin [Ruania albidiflava]
MRPVRAPHPPLHRHGTEADQQRGSVTAELAVLLPAVVLAIVVILAVASAGVMQVRCADAARAGARAAALGQDDAQVAAVVHQLAGEDATVTVTRSEEWVDVRVAAEVPLGPLSGVLHTDVVFSALPEPTGAAEPGEGT